MFKFCKLVGNEWKKQFRKAATWIMLVILVFVVVGAAGFSFSLSFLEYAYDESDFWQSELEYNQQYTNEKDAQGNLTEYAMDCRVRVELYSYLLDNSVSSDDWRYTSGLMNDMAEAKVRGEEATYQKLLSILESENPNAYFAYRQDADILADPANTEIYRWFYETCVEKNLTPSSSDWKYQTLNEVKSAKITVAEEETLKAAKDPQFNESEWEKAKNTVLLGLYQVEHGQEVNPADCMGGNSLFGSGFWCAMENSTSLISFAGLISIVIAGGIIANEFSTGTVKFLLLNPVKRWKILMSKYVTALLIGALMMGIIFLGTFLVAGAFDGFSQASLPYLSVRDGKVITKSPYLLLLGEYLLSSVKLVVMATLSFAISSLVHSSALAIGISLFAYFTGSAVTEIMQLLELDFARYFLFSNMDFAAIVNQTTGFVHHSLGVAILIVCLHMFVFLLTAWDGFVRREI